MWRTLGADAGHLPTLMQWMASGEAKVVLKGRCKKAGTGAAELAKLESEARERGIPAFPIRDAGRTRHRRAGAARCCGAASWRVEASRRGAESWRGRGAASMTRAADASRGIAARARLGHRGAVSRRGFAATRRSEVGSADGQKDRERETETERESAVEKKK